MQRHELGCHFPFLPHVRHQLQIWAAEGRISTGIAAAAPGLQIASHQGVTRNQLQVVGISASLSESHRINKQHTAEQKQYICHGHGGQCTDCLIAKVDGPG